VNLNNFIFENSLTTFRSWLESELFCFFVTSIAILLSQLVQSDRHPCSHKSTTNVVCGSAYTGSCDRGWLQCRFLSVRLIRSASAWL